MSVCHLAFRLINGVLLFQLEKNKKPGLSLVINENTQQDPWDSSFRYVWVSCMETKRFANLKLLFFIFLCDFFFTQEKSADLLSCERNVISFELSD